MMDSISTAPRPASTEPRTDRAAAARKIEPAPCERDYSAEELQFMHAMQEYKKSSGRMFPTWSEVLEVLKGLGYQKPSS